MPPEPSGEPQLRGAHLLPGVVLESLTDGLPVVVAYAAQTAAVSDERVAEDMGRVLVAGQP